MKYSIKAHPTLYKCVMFRSRLEARWACMFDLVEWEWQYEPIDIHGWSPDFHVKFKCGHSECNGFHTLLVEVKPYFDLSQFSGHRCMDFEWGGIPEEEGGKGVIPADASAAFGCNPDVTFWCMAHGAGGGNETFSGWAYQHGDIDELWKIAGNTVQWKPEKRVRKSNDVMSDADLSKFMRDKRREYGLCFACGSPIGHQEKRCRKCNAQFSTEG
jgi:hypothetical protein